MVVIQILVGVVSSLVVALIIAMIKAFVEIQILRNEVNRLEKDRVAHESSNNSTLESLFKSMHEIERQLNILIGKFDKQ